MPDRYSIVGRLRQHAAAYPGRDAVISPDSILSYSKLVPALQSEVQRLVAAGIAPDSTVAIRCKDEVRHLLLTLAAIDIGSTSFAVSSQQPLASQQQLLDRCAATHIIGDDSIEALPSNNRAVANASGEARLLFSTSGTTGEPKVVVHYDSDLVAQAHRHIDSEQERFACLASMEHNFVKRHRLYCVAVGACNVFLDAAHDELVDQIESLNADVLHVSAFQAQELLAVPNINRLSSIRLKLGGSHVPIALRQQLREQITDKLQAGYGTTETGAIGFTKPEDTTKNESVGQALDGIEVRVVDHSQNALAAGERGELAIRCAGMFREYLGDPGLTAARLNDGWFLTGDIGYLDSEHRIHLAGRADDMFTFNSMNIYPQDIETRICQYPGVIESVVLPKTSIVHGNIPVAFVVSDPDANVDLVALQAFVKEQLGVRSPRHFESVEELPRNSSGKISRSKALELWNNSNDIREAIIESLNVDALDRIKPSTVAAYTLGQRDIRLRDIRLDSFARMEILVMLELRFDVVISPVQFSRLNTLGDISDYVMTNPRSESPQTAAPVHGGVATDAPQDSTPIYLVRFVQRVFRCCHTVAQLHKALATLAHRLTPLEVIFLHTQHRDRQLLAANSAEKFSTALSAWFARLIQQMDESGKSEPEPFKSRRLTPTATHFIGPQPANEKTLIICFSGKGDRHLMMPNSVLLQHSNAKLYDFLVIAEPMRTSYRHGVPSLGKTLNEVVDWLSRQEMVSDYKAIRTIGCSAGAHAAVIAAYRLGAELAVSVGGRFHAERYPLKILDRIYSTWRSARRGQCDRVLLSYPTDRSRDHIYAKIMARLTGGNLLGLTFEEEKVGHLIFERLLERGEVAPYLANTIFTNSDSPILSTSQSDLVLHLPAGELGEARSSA